MALVREIFLDEPGGLYVNNINQEYVTGKFNLMHSCQVDTLAFGWSRRKKAKHYSFMCKHASNQ